MSIESSLQINWFGCWEKRPDRAICRYILSWSVLGDSIFGTIGGYSGGGAFQLEKFAVPKDGAPLIEADVDLSETLTGDEIEACEDCQSHALSFHIEESWLDWDTLHLDIAKVDQLSQDGDLLFSQSAKLPRNLLPLFEMIGLLTRPSGDIIDNE